MTALTVGRWTFERQAERWTVTRTKKEPPPPMSSVPATSGGSGGFLGWAQGIVREAFPGAWQRNVEVVRADVLAFSTVFACITLIAQDIAKLWLRLKEVDANGIWTETSNPAYSPVLRKPNHYQTRIQFIEQWVTSKLAHGNTYVLLARDNRGVVIDMYVLDPLRVTPMVAPDGSVYYALGTDYLSGLNEQTYSLTVPASEIIHDRWNCLFHPLVGLSPIFACGLAATQGLKIQEQSANRFANGSMIGGVLTSPLNITGDVADTLQRNWERNYSGEENMGKIAIIGNGMKFEPLPVMTAVNAQLIEQLKWTGEQVCAVFKVQPFMVAIGPPPPYNNIQALQLQYYAQALQSPIEALELCLDEGLGMAGRDTVQTIGVELDLDALLRMDTLTQMEVASKGVVGGILSPDEARSRFDLPPVAGGKTPYLQSQNWPLAQLADRQMTPAGPSPQPMGSQTPSVPDTPKAAPCAACQDTGLLLDRTKADVAEPCPVCATGVAVAKALIVVRDTVTDLEGETGTLARSFLKWAA